MQEGADLKYAIWKAIIFFDVLFVLVCAFF